MKNDEEIREKILDFLKELIDSDTSYLIWHWGGGVDPESQKRQNEWAEQRFLDIQREFGHLKKHEKEELFQLHIDIINFLDYFKRKQDESCEKRCFIRENFSNETINVDEELNNLRQQADELKTKFKVIKKRFDDKPDYFIYSMYKKMLGQKWNNGFLYTRIELVDYEIKRINKLEEDYNEYLETKNRHRLILDKLKNQKNTIETSKFKNILKKLKTKTPLSSKKEKSKMNNIVNNRIKELNNQSIMSFDAETNGLWGQAFAISAVVYNEKCNELNRFSVRCPIEEEVNPWVAENVLPKMNDIPETHNNYKDMLEDFFTFYNNYKDSVTVLSHMGHIVEAKLIRDAHNLGIIGDWDAPYLWYDVCLFFGDSVDNYVKEHNIHTGMEDQTHNPLYDSVVAYKAFKHFVESVNN